MKIGGRWQVQIAKNFRFVDANGIHRKPMEIVGIGRCGDSRRSVVLSRRQEGISYQEADKK